MWTNKLADLKIDDVVFNVGLYENKLLVQFKGIFYLVDNRLSGLFDKKSSDFLDRKVFSFTPKDVISFKCRLEEISF